MKKMTTILTALVLLLTTSAFASGIDNTKIKTVFTKDFTQAENVNWQEIDGLYFADFQLDGKVMKAAYDKRGELIATSQIVSKEQLPAAITAELEKNYAGFEMSGTITQLNIDGKTDYYFSVENEKRVLNLKCNSDGTVDVESKISK